jgi:hypothetical protein
MNFQPIIKMNKNVLLQSVSLLLLIVSSSSAVRTPPPPPRSLSTTCDISGAYKGTGFCDSSGSAFPFEVTELNTIDLLPMSENSTAGNNGDWIQNNITNTDGGFNGIEHCTLDVRGTQLSQMIDEGPVYNCITANVILQYTFNEDCTSFYKLVQIVGSSDGTTQPATICKIVAIDTSSPNTDTTTDFPSLDNAQVKTSGGVTNSSLLFVLMHIIVIVVTVVYA